MLNSRFNLEEYFSRGFTVTQVPKGVCDSLFERVKAENFRAESKVYDTNPMLPPWDAHDSKNNKVPEYIKAFWDELAGDEYFSYFQLVYGQFSHKNMLLQKYVKDTVLPWHQDIHEGLHVTNVLYLTDERWEMQDGGYLKLGRWSLDDAYWGKLDTAEELGRVVPNHGVLVSICNVIPTFCHAVAPVVGNKSRYSLICRMGYKENVDGNKLSGLF